MHAIKMDSAEVLPRLFAVQIVIFILHALFLFLFALFGFLSSSAFFLVSLRWLPGPEWPHHEARENNAPQQSNSGTNLARTSQAFIWTSSLVILSIEVKRNHDLAQRFATAENHSTLLEDFVSQLYWRILSLIKAVHQREQA